MKLSTFFRVGAAVLVFAFAGTVSTAASITNGAFESPGTFSGGFQNTSSLDGWSVTGNVDLINTYWTPSEGAYSLDLNGTSSSASISQVITGLVAGQTYKILFDLSGNPAGPPPEKQLRVSTDEGAGSYSYNTSTSGTTLGDMKWTTEMFSFLAAGTSTTLTFASAQTASSFGPALDNIRFETAVVPLPASGLLLIGALGALALRRRR